MVRGFGHERQSRQQARGEPRGGDWQQSVRRAGADAGLGQRQPAAGGGQDAAEAPRQIEPRRHQQAGAGSSVGLRLVGGFGRIEAGGQDQHHARAGGRGQRGQFLHLGGVERIAPRRIDQHRHAVLATGQGAAEGDRMAGDDQADAEQPGEGGELLGGAGTLAVGGDHHRSDASHHQACGQTGDGQCLAGAWRTDQQQRRLDRAAGCRTGSHWPARSRVRRAAGRRAARRGRHGSRVRRGGRCLRVPAAAATVAAGLGLQRGGDFHAVTKAAGGEDQRVLAQFGADLCHRLRHRGSAEELQAHGGTRRRPLPPPPPARGGESMGYSPSPCGRGLGGGGAADPHIVPTVRIFARGWISACASTGVLGRMRSMIARTWPRMPPEVSSTGDSPALRGGIERGAQLLHEVLQLARRHRELTIFRRPGQRLGELRLPLGRQRDQRDVAAGPGMAVADLPRQPRADMRDDRRNGARRRRRTPPGCPPGSSAGRGSRRARASRLCSTRCTPPAVICDGIRSATSFCCSRGSSSSSFCVSA